MEHRVSKYNSAVGILGGVPDYSVMIDHINHLLSDCPAEEQTSFQFRTNSATGRFSRVVESCFLSFENDSHRHLFKNAVSSNDFTLEEKLIILFWQLAYCNVLFSEITSNVFLRALYSGRTSISSSDVEAFMKHLKVQSPEDMSWSDSTIKTTASKYLTVLKKLGFADGKIQKAIRAPHISSSLFIYLVKFALSAYPDFNNLDNPMFRYSFLDNQSIINRLKTIEYIPLWDITQVANDITITLK